MITRLDSKFLFTALLLNAAWFPPLSFSQVSNETKSETNPTTEQKLPGEAMPDQKFEEKPKRIDTLEEWRRIDDQLVLAVQRFVLLSQRKQELQDKMGKAKGRFEPGDVTPGSILNRKQMTGIATKYDELLKQTAEEKVSVSSLMRRVYGSRRELVGLLDARKTEIEQLGPERGSPESSYELERVTRWLGGLRRGEGNGPQPLLREIVGEELGREMMQGPGPRRGESSPQRRRGQKPAPGEDHPPPPGANTAFPPPGPPPGDGRTQPDPADTPEGPDSPDHPRQGPPPDARMLQERLDRLERENARLQSAIQRLRHEVEALRQQLGAKKG